MLLDSLLTGDKGEWPDVHKLEKEEIKERSTTLPLK